MAIKNVFFILAGIVLLIMAYSPASAADTADIENIVIRESYEPGKGPAIGGVSQVAGTVIIVHAGQDDGYRAVKGLDLFKGDTLKTGKDGRAAFKLNDGSFISLSPKTTMEIKKSVYAPKQKTRSSFMSMVMGKARFVVKKFVDARYSEFKVKTKTSVAGVRGSDFIIASSETLTEISALEKTELAVISLSHPEAPPLILHDFEKTVIRLGFPPEAAQKVKVDEVDRLMKEFKYFKPEPTLIEQEFTVSAVPVNVKNIIMEDADLILPGIREPLRIPERPERMDNFLRSKNILIDEHLIEERKVRISEEKNDLLQKTPLPDFPETP